MTFDPHGNFDISVRGDILIVRLSGSWNLEGAKSFFAVYKERIMEQGLSRFGVLADFRELEGATPDSIVYFEEISRWTYDHGQVARAQLLASSLAAYISAQVTRDKIIFPIRSFESEPDALAWLADQGLNPF